MRVFREGLGVQDLMILWSGGSQDIEMRFGISEGRLMSMVFRRVTVIALLLAFLGGFSTHAAANSKYAAYVVHAESGDVLFSRYANGRRYPASLTKMMTLYLLFEEIEAGRLTMDSKITVSKRAAGQPPSKLGLKSGGTIDVETAIEALVIKSANDVAAAVSEEISGSEWRFAQKMTSKARALGMSRTTFRNASGLPNSKQVTTARDMATLAQRVSQDFPQYFHYFSKKQFTWNGRTYRTHNKLIKTFDGADGLKTGYTRRSGFNLATTAVRSDQRLIGIVLGGRSSATRDRHMRDILSKGFAQIAKKPTLIAALHRKKPSPRLKPTLMAALEAQQAAPTIAESDALRLEILTAAAALSDPASAEGSETDQLGALIAVAETDDFNEFERTRLASLTPDEGFVGQGDRQSLSEFDWNVQIGAFSTKELAQQELEDAVAKGGLTNRARTVVPTRRNDGSTLYRARIIAMSEAEATNACATLKDNDVSCFVVSDASTQLN